MEIILSTTSTLTLPGLRSIFIQISYRLWETTRSEIERGNTFFTFNYKEGLKLTHKSHSLHRIIAGVTLTMKIATYLTGLVFLRTWIWTFLTTVWTPSISGRLPESRQMFFWGFLGLGNSVISNQDFVSMKV